MAKRRAQEGRCPPRGVDVSSVRVVDTVLERLDNTQTHNDSMEKEKVKVKEKENNDEEMKKKTAHTISE